METNTTHTGDEHYLDIFFNLLYDCKHGEWWTEDDFNRIWSHNLIRKLTRQENVRLRFDLSEMFADQFEAMPLISPAEDAQHDARARETLAKFRREQQEKSQPEK